MFDLSPPTGDALTLRSCIFNDASTYINYVGHLRGACFFYKLDIFWLSPDVRHIAKGSAKRQNRSFRTPNFIRRSLRMSIVEFEIASVEFAHVDYISSCPPFGYIRDRWLCAKLSPSPISRIIREHPNNDMT